MDDESGESIEPMEKCHSKNCVSQDWRDWSLVDGEKPGVDSRDEGKSIPFPSLSWYKSSQHPFDMSAICAASVKFSPFTD